jgi:murein L,D-transpeptidase YcbB/YkuD
MSERTRRLARCAALTVSVLSLATLLVSTPAAGVTPQRHLKNDTHQLCNFDDPSAPQANSRYPFTFLLSTRLESTTDRDVRRAVRSVQEVLRAENVKDMDGNRLAVDGVYGAKTRYAVKAFQRRNQLTVDGKVGQQTWSKLASNCWKYH